MAVDVADEKPDRLEPGEREVVRADPRRRRVVLNGRVVVAADAALDAAEVRREIEPETEPRQRRRRVRQRPAIRLRPPEQPFEGGRRLRFAERVVAPAAWPRRRVGRRRRRQPEQANAESCRERPQKDSEAHGLRTYSLSRGTAGTIPQLGWPRNLNQGYIQAKIPPAFAFSL